MTATVRLPRMLTDVVKADSRQEVSGATVAASLEDLFSREPGLRNHVLDEAGQIRPHVSVFVDGAQSDLGTGVTDTSEIRILHAVSGGGWV